MYTVFEFKSKEKYFCLDEIENMNCVTYNADLNILPQMAQLSHGMNQLRYRQHRIQLMRSSLAS